MNPETPLPPTGSYPARDAVSAAGQETTDLKTSPPAAAPVSLHLHAGTQPVPGYTLEARLGRGGFGEVWRAQGPGGFKVAMKFIPLEHKAGTVELRSLDFMKEIRHPHLLPMFGAWDRDGYLVIAMELAVATLYDRLQEAATQGRTGLPVAELLTFMAEAAKGIDYLNSVNIQHRDIKPQNLLLVGGSVKVADFGLAKVLEHSIISASGAMTPAYAAPEFLSGQTSRWSDQYCLAATYCHLRGNALPFTGHAAQVITGHLTKAPDLSMLPAPERPVVARALAKEPSERWPNCQAFVATLQAVAQGEAPVVAERAAEDNGSTTIPVLKPVRSAPVGPRGFSGLMLGCLIVLGVGLAVFLGVALMLFWWVGMPTETRLSTSVASTMAEFRQNNDIKGGGEMRQMEPLPPARQLPRVPVLKAEPQLRKIELATLRGHLVPTRTVDLTVRVDGFIASLACKEGMVVKQGDVLLKMDDREVQNAVRQAEAEVQKSQAELRVAEADLARSAGALKRQAISQAEHDKYIGMAEAAKAQVRVAEAALEKAKLKLADSQVVAPFDGVVTKVSVDPSEMIIAAHQKPLIQLVTLQPLRINFNIPNETKVLLAAMPRDTVIEFQATQAETQIQETGTIAAYRAQMTELWLLPNTRKLLRAGMAVDLRIIASVPVQVLPKSAVGTVERRPTILVVDENHNVRPVGVNVLYTQDKDVVVLALALPPGSLVLANWEGNLGQGQKVSTEPAK